VKGRLLLNVVVGKGTAILELLAGEDETLLIGWDTPLVLNLRLYVVDGVGRFNLKSDGLSGKSLYEDLHTTTETENQVKGRLLLNVVVGKGTAILELLAGEDETLLIGWDTLLVLNLRLYIVDGVGRFNLKSDGLSGKSLDKDLHTTTETENQVKSGLLLNVVVRESATILKLLSGKDQALLVRGNALLVLDLGLNIVDGIRGFNFEGDGLSGEGLDEDLHTATKTENEMEGGLLLDVVIRESATVLELLAGEDQALLVRRNALLILDLALDVVDGVRGLDLKGDGLAGKGLDEDLHLDDVLVSSKCV
jgi:hypothetical protein